MLLQAWVNECNGDVSPKARSAGHIGVLFSQPFVVLTPVGVVNPKSLVNGQISDMTKPYHDLAVSRKFRPVANTSR